MKKKIVIIGGLGYIGTELCKIYSGTSWYHSIIVIDNRFISERVNQLRNWNIDFIHGDILDKDLLKREKEIIDAQVSDSDKPEEIIEKMVFGRLEKFKSEVSLLSQPFVKDPSKKVDDLVRENDNVVLKFFRYELGEGIEVEKMDFAEEVKSQLEK